MSFDVPHMQISGPHHTSAPRIEGCILHYPEEPDDFYSMTCRTDAKTSLAWSIGHSITVSAEGAQEFDLRQNS